MGLQEANADFSTPSGKTIPAIVLASVTSSAPIAVPTEWLGKYVMWKFIGVAATDKLCIRFGTDNTVAVALATASTVAGSPGYAISPAGTEPMLVLSGSGVGERKRIDKRHLFFAHIANAATGFLYAQLAHGESGAGG